MSPDQGRQSQDHQSGGHQSEGREDNAAVPKAPGTSEVSPTSYPPTRADDSVELEGGEPRSFEPPANPQPRQGAGDAPAPHRDLSGPAGDPAEGKR